MLRATRERADREVSPDDVPWVELTPRYARRKARKHRVRSMLRFNNFMLARAWTTRSAPPTSTSAPALSTAPRTSLAARLPASRRGRGTDVHRLAHLRRALMRVHDLMDRFALYGFGNFLVRHDSPRWISVIPTGCPKSLDHCKSPVGRQLGAAVLHAGWPALLRGL